MNEQTNDNHYEMDGANRQADDSLKADVNQPEQTWQGATQSELDQAESEQAVYSPPGKKSLFNKNGLFFMGACVLAVLMMYVFGMKNKPKESSAQDIEVETKIDEMLEKLGGQARQKETKELFGDSSDMVQLFYEYPSKQQVTLKELSRNPFERISSPKADPVDHSEVLKASLTEKLKSLKLRSVMMGPNGGICNISGRMYSVGKKVVDTFEIKAVGSDNVTLTSSGFEFILQM
ncbi:MAG: hypothetical protein IID32_10925 [Planctomycetes bacterium]|nr:hypothetical protein [Planctomycetota bacterium]